jgi:hypothetical protein
MVVTKSLQKIANYKFNLFNITKYLLGCKISAAVITEAASEILPPNFSRMQGIRILKNLRRMHPIFFASEKNSDAARMQKSDAVITESRKKNTAGFSFFFRIQLGSKNRIGYNERPKGDGKKAHVFVTE